MNKFINLPVNTSLMPGILVHLGTALVCFLIVHFIHFRMEFSLSVFIGNFIPDVVKFGFSGIKQMTFDLLKIKHDDTYNFLNAITSSPANWFALGMFLFGMTIFLYDFHVIKKKTMREYDELYVFLVVGIVLHIIMDFFFIERGIWY
jgi:hypothetical protein